MRPLLASLAIFVSLLLALGLHAQPAAKDGKGAGKQTGQEKQSGKEIKQADGKKDGKSNDGSSPPSLTLDKLKLPADAIVILVEKAQEVIELIPKAIYMSPAEYDALQDRIRALEQQLKGEKATTHSCKLTGKLEGDYVALKAEFTFSTQQSKTAVVLGLQGAHLVDEGNLDKMAPQLDYGDDGFVVHVAKEGTHHLTLNLKAPVVLKKGPGLAGPVRGFDLGHPGALATTMNLELPAAVKEVRVNDAPKKSKTPGRWDVPLGLAKQISVAWKEPQAVVGGGPLMVLDANVVVKLDESSAQVQADLALEDLRGQAKEWRLLLPSFVPQGTEPTVKSLPAGTYQWVLPNGKNAWHVLQLKEAVSERILISFQASVQRPAPKLAIGPFALAGAFRQQGTVLVQATPDALRGQRLVFHRQGEVTQRDLPKSVPGMENLAFFQYAVVPPPGTNAVKAPVELEFKASTGLAETQADHTVRLKGEADAWYLETTTRIQAKSLAEVTDFLDVQLPRSRLAGLEIFTGVPGAAFPACLPWTGMLPPRARMAWALPVEFRWEEEGSELTLPDGTRQARLRWSRQNVKQFTLTIHGKYAVPPGAGSVRVELPRPLGILDRGGALSVHSGPSVELLTGPAGAEEPVPERQHWFRQLETAPRSVDLAWRPYQPVMPVTAVVDVTIHERSAQVRQHLHLQGLSAKGATPDNLRFRVAPELKRLSVASGGKLLGDAIPENATVWISPFADAAGKCDLVLEYDVALPGRDDADAQVQAARPWNVPLVWPEAATRQDAKVRLWCPPGTFPALAQPAQDWHERGIESVPGRENLPALVVQGAGGTVPLTLQLRPAFQGALATLLCDRTLIQVHVDEDGNQFYRARFLVRKLAARQLTVEFPVAVRDKDSGLLAVRFVVDKQEKGLPWNDPVWNVATIDLPQELPNFQAQTVFLELEYKLPAAEGPRLGHTLLHPPRWHGDVLPGAVRWQVELPADHVALVAGGGATLDYRWTLQGWLLAPEANVTSADLEAWLTGRGGGEPTPVGMTYWRPGLATQWIVHLPRPWWLLVCSGFVLALGLALYLIPLGRALLWLLAAAICIGVVAAALLWPALLPPLLYGSEPGLAVLAVLLGLQWFLQERYRRQVVVMPGFARLQAGSSLSRGGQTARPREPSTVDAPAASVASVNSSVK